MEIEVARSNKRIALSQRKYMLDMLSEVDILWCKVEDTLMDPNLKPLPDTVSS